MAQWLELQTAYRTREVGCSILTAGTVDTPLTICSGISRLCNAAPGGGGLTLTGMDTMMVGWWVGVAIPT